MTVDARHTVNVVFAGARQERRVHLCHIQSARRAGGMARGTGSARIVRVGRVARRATDALMHAGRRAVIAASSVPVCVWGVTLRAEPLTRIRRNFHGAALVDDFRHHQIIDSDMRTLRAHIERKRVTPEGGRVRARAHTGFIDGQIVKGLTGRVQLVTRQTRNRGPFRHHGIPELPRPLRIKRRRQT